MEKKILLDEHRDQAEAFIARTNPLEAQKEAIREAFKEYVAPERVALYEAHQAAAKSIEALYDALADAGLREGLATPAFLINHMVVLGTKDSGGNCTVTPKEFNYNSGLKLN